MIIISASPKIRFGKETFILGTTSYLSISFLCFHFLILSKAARRLHLMTMSDLSNDPHYIVRNDRRFKLVLRRDRAKQARSLRQQFNDQNQLLRDTNNTLHIENEHLVNLIESTESQNKTLLDAIEIKTNLKI